MLRFGLLWNDDTWVVDVDQFVARAARSLIVATEHHFEFLLRVEFAAMWAFSQFAAFDCHGINSSELRRQFTGSRVSPIADDFGRIGQHSRHLTNRSFYVLTGSCLRPTH